MVRSMVVIILFISVHNALHDGVAYHVGGLEEIKADFFDVFEDFDGVAQAGLGAFGQVDLGDITGDDRLGTEADAR